MSSIYGDKIRLSIFGQSHGAAIGMTLDSVPAGLPVDMEQLSAFLQRRSPGKDSYSTTRLEMDQPEFLSGIVDGFTCGAPITAIIRNQNVRSDDYARLKDQPRPGHADLTAQIKYGGYQDVSGGGHFSGRLTAALCIAGGLCKQWLAIKGIQIGAHISSIAGIADSPAHFNALNPELSAVHTDFPVLCDRAGEEMKKAIISAKNDADSVGGIIECAAIGLPAGLGDPMFFGMESRIAQIVYSIPAVKGLDFGSGFYGSSIRGSENNDPFTFKDGEIISTSNNAGGILGGITTGMPLIFRVAVKPTPSIALPQTTISFSLQKDTTLQITGRHDPCIVPRAVPVVEAAAAIAIFDTMNR